jgi:hypothetical protein
LYAEAGQPARFAAALAALAVRPVSFGTLQAAGAAGASAADSAAALAATTTTRRRARTAEV